MNLRFAHRNHLVGTPSPLSSCKSLTPSAALLTYFSLSVSSPHLLSSGILVHHPFEEHLAFLPATAIAINSSFY